MVCKQGNLSNELTQRAKKIFRSLKPVILGHFITALTDISHRSLGLLPNDFGRRFLFYPFVSISDGLKLFF